MTRPASDPSQPFTLTFGNFQNMNFSMILRASAVSLATASAHAAVVYTSGSLDTVIPDDTDTGVVHSLNVAESIAVGSVTVDLNLSVPSGQTGWVGDLYVYLQHDSGLSVLVNRPGVTAGNPAGYADSRTISIRLADSAAHDIHDYRSSAGINLSGPLSGNWQPDGRTTDPAWAVQSDPRNAPLSVFNGMNSAGTWTLFLADLSGGSLYRLDSWTLQIAPVPEPESVTAIGAAALVGFALWRRHRR